MAYSARWTGELAFDWLKNDCGMKGFTSKRWEVVGVQCNQSSGVCEKESFLDIVDYHADLGVTEHCKWDPISGMAYLIAGVQVAEKQAHPHREIFAPMLQALYDNMWTAAFPNCENDSDCETVFYNRNIQGRCAPEPNECGDRLCEFRPMFFRGVNLYPNDIEMVFAYSPNDPEVPFYRAAGYCDPPQQQGWSDIRGDWLH